MKRKIVVKNPPKKRRKGKGASKNSQRLRSSYGNMWGRLAASAKYAVDISNDCTPEKKKRVLDKCSENSQDYSCRLIQEVDENGQISYFSSTPSKTPLKVSNTITYRNFNKTERTITLLASQSPPTKPTKFPIVRQLFFDQSIKPKKSINVGTIPKILNAEVTISPIAIDFKRISKWQGRKRSITQQQVINGHSANKLAEHYGFNNDMPKGQRYELNHASAHRWGGIDGIEPQEIKNLFGGTYENNSAMLIFENQIANYIGKNKLAIIILTITIKYKKDNTGTLTIFADEVIYSYHLQGNPNTFTKIFYPCKEITTPNKSDQASVDIIFEGCSQILTPVQQSINRC